MLDPFEKNKKPAERFASAGLIPEECFGNYVCNLRCTPPTRCARDDDDDGGDEHGMTLIKD